MPDFKLFDGTILRFPDGTSEDVITKTVQQETARIRATRAGLANTSEAARVGMAGQTTPERDRLYGSPRSSHYYRQPEWLQDTPLGRADVFFKDLTDTATEGFTLGASNEVGAAASYLGPRTYDQSLEEQRADFDLFRDEYPVASYAADLGAGFVTAPQRTLPRLWQIMARAGLEGGAGGFLSGEGETNRLIGAGVGAGAGIGLAGGGAVLGGGIRRISDIFNSADTNADRQIARAIARDAGGTGENRLRGAFGRQSVTPGDYATRMADEIVADPNRGLTAFDVGGENLMGTARYAARTPGEGREVMTDFLNTRQMGAYDTMTGLHSGGSVDRVLGDLSDAGMPRTSSTLAAQRVEGGMRLAADPAYKAAYSAPVDARALVSDIDQFFDRPTFRSAIRPAIRMLADEGVDVSDLQKLEPIKAWDALAAGDPRLFQFLDFVKRTVGKVASNPRHPGTAVLNNANEQFRDALMRHNPAYADAITKYASDSDNLRAIEFGEGIWRSSGEEIKRFLSGASDSEKTMFRIGAAQAIRDRLNAAGRGTNLSEWLAKNRDRVEILRESFPDEQSFLKFMDNLMKEGGMTERFRNILKNSVTTQAAADIADGLGETAGFFGDVASGGIVNAALKAIRVLAERGADKFGRGIGEQTAAAIAKKLTAGTAAERAAYITKLVQDGVLSPQTGKELQAVMQAISMFTVPATRGTAEYLNNQ